MALLRLSLTCPAQYTYIVVVNKRVCNYLMHCYNNLLRTTRLLPA